MKTNVIGNIATFQDYKGSVRVATTGALAANTRTDNTLTASANGALAAIDGVALNVADRLLVKNEVAGANNGLWVVRDLGDGSSPWILDRTVDANTSNDVTSGLLVSVEEGTANAGLTFRLTTANPITLNTTSLVFAEASAIPAEVLRTDTANEFSEVANKATPVSADLLLIEDSADGWNKKNITVGAIGAPAAVVRTDTADEFSEAANKATPVAADRILLEDSADSWAKKYATLQLLIRTQPTLRGFPAGDPAGCTTRGRWEFDNNGNDLSGNGYHLTRTGYECWGWYAGKRGTMLIGDARWTITTAAAPLLNIQGDLTIELLCAQASIRQTLYTQIELLDYGTWIACREASTAGGATGGQSAYSLSSGLSATPYYGTYYAHTSTGPAFMGWSTPNVQPPNVPCTITVVRSGGGTNVDLYFDGILAASQTGLAVPSCTPDTFYIGASPYSGGYYAIRGWIGGVVVSSGAASSTTVRERSLYALGY